MRLQIRGPVWFWRGPAPWFFVTVPAAEAEVLHDMSGEVSYGWGMIPATVIVGATTYATALWPKDGRYIVPIRAAVRKAEQIAEDHEIDLVIEIGTPGPATPRRPSRSPS